MEYEITILKREPNPNYMPERPCNYPGNEQYISARQLSTVLTEEEFKKIRDAVLKEF